MCWKDFGPCQAFLEQRFVDGRHHKFNFPSTMTVTSTRSEYDLIEALSTLSLELMSILMIGSCASGSQAQEVERMIVDLRYRRGTKFLALGADPTTAGRVGP